MACGADDREAIVDHVPDDLLGMEGLDGAAIVYRDSAAGRRFESGHAAPDVIIELIALHIAGRRAKKDQAQGSDTDELGRPAKIERRLIDAVC